MKKALPAAIALLIFLGLASPAYAIEPFRPALMNKMASRAAEMKEKQQTKLQQFRDQRKAKIVEQLTTMLNKINQRHTEQMTKNLSRMTEILSKVTANSKTPAAQTAIATAQAAVTAQAAKDYTITVTDEATARVDAQKTKEQLRTDIEATKKLVMEAKKSLIEAIKEGDNE